MSDRVPVNRQGIPQHWMRHAEDYLTESLYPRSTSQKLRSIMDERGWPPYDRTVGERLLAIVEAAEAVPELGEDNYVLSDLREALGELDKALP